jgi:uncharacterized glyoxalase superfamily protein PhnB
MAVKPIPDGYTSVTPYLAVEGADKLLEFVKQAFGAEEIMSMPTPDGKIGHAEVKIGGSIVMLGDASQSEFGGMPGMVHLYVDDVDKTYRQAIEAGAKSLREPKDEFYGDRAGGVEDPTGNRWWISTHVEDVPPDELQRRMKELEQQH